MTKRKKIGIGILIAVAILVLGLQLFYPQNRALPFAKIQGNSVAWVEENILASQLQKKFEDSFVAIKVGQQTEKMPLSYYGAQVDSEAMAAKLTEYPLWQRAIPFSILFAGQNLQTVDAYFDSNALTASSEDMARKLTIEPKNAQLAIKGGELVATNSASGHTVTSQQVASLFANATFYFDTTTLTIDAAEVAPKQTDEDLAPVRAQAENIIAHKITIDGVDGKTFTPNAADIASWIVLASDKKGKTTLTLDDTHIKSYVEGINKKIKIAPTSIVVKLVDSKEVSRSKGKDGRELNSDELVAGLKKAVNSEEKAVQLTATTRKVSPYAIYDRQYTSTQTGLRAYVNYVAYAQNVRISLVQMTGGHWTAAAREKESIPSASTYKLYVALVLFDRINKGEIKWDDKMLDTTVAGCFERTIVPSTNPCAEKWIAEFGRTYINNFIYNLGFSHGTTFTNPEANHTTAADLTNYMIGLYGGTLVSGNNRSILLEKMGRQLYRYGIPTGSKGSVQDKVGFLWDYVHDTAIVKHPKGTYIVTIMTKGGSYARIAEITRQLERIMYP